MTRLIILIFLLLDVMTSMKADGPPIDTTGKIFCKFVSITLDSSQILQLQKSRWIELTPSQRKKLPFVLPKTIDVVDPYYSSCTCGMIYAMWYDANKIGFCITKGDTVLNKQGKIDESTDDEFLQFYNNYPKTASKNHVYVGLKGELFYMNKLIQPKDLKQIAKSKTGKKDEDYLVFLLPPTKGNADANKVKQTRVQIAMILPLNFTYYWD